ncbi:NADH:ubiquinone oxidoreductase 49 kD subunit 7 [Thioflavicoccus mobilis 8321]|uniref:NADH:ubiquinone oxidoreductase 49 kD subunit 7 n=1 Tax=Thioflavicoccus mobilis 8321 TaxID=765912 RepID=L0GWL3_9GAMM|nr:NADH-quinone oxidoreductase subunit D [Thioflavicoccus mobilis]AGA91148.1 NADH:ubiquinone oxidoreductase 49 kD subunit 7 [Thioflavicoccus mobilis 8321]
MTDTIKIFHGPQHPGVTGNMSLELDLDGETIVAAKTHVGYLHRGFEKLIERRTVIQAFTIVCRICVPEPDPNEENFARGVEELLGLEISERAKYIRVMVLELARLQAHYLWLAGQGGSIGHGVVPQWAVGERDYILDLFEELTGGRVYHMYIYPGGVKRDLPAGFLERLCDLVDDLERRLPEYDRIFFDNTAVKKRLQGVGVVDPDEALRHGYAGPVIRACGLPRDVRRDAPYLVYDQLEFDIPTETAGDAYARALVRRAEMYQSLRILRQVAERMPADGPIQCKLPSHRKLKLPKAETYVQSESARGAFGYFMAGDGSERLRRLQVRGPSLVHAFTLLEPLLIGAQLADVALIMVSLTTCPPEIER